MTVSRTNVARIDALRSGGWGVVFFLSALMLCPDWTMAQQGGAGGSQRLQPRQLLPDGRNPPAEAPARESLQAPTSEIPTQSFPVIPDAAVQIDALRSIDPDATGILSGTDGGFSDDLWAGSEWSTVKILIEGLPVATSSPAMRSLMRRVLLSAAAVPEGGREPGSFMALRVRQLFAMGDLVGAGDLLATMPNRDSNEALARIESDIRFLLNDNARACAVVATQISRSTDVHWQKASIFCQVLVGERDKADLGLSLLRELGTKDDIFFRLVADVIVGRTGGLSTMPGLTPLHLAIARVAKAPLPSDVVSSGQLAILRTIATTPNAPVELRLEAAERAEMAGALPTETLRQLYTSVGFTEQDLANPLTKADTSSGPLARALLYRTALVQSVPAAKAEAASRALVLARSGGRYTSAVRAFMPVISDIPPADELIWFAPEAIRAFLVGGEGQRAQGWLRLLRASAVFRDEAKLEVAKLIPIARLAGVEDERPWAPDRLTEWWTAVKGEEGSRERAALLFTLIESVGDVVPDPLWTVLIGGFERAPVVMPNPAIWDRLEVAAVSGRLGETVLLTLLAIGASGPGEVNPIVLRRVLASLATLGLEKDIRALAIEAVVTANL